MIRNGHSRPFIATDRNVGSTDSPFTGTVVFFVTQCNLGGGCCATVQVTTTDFAAGNQLQELWGEELWMGVSSRPVTVVDGNPVWPEGTTEADFTLPVWVEDED